jgi:hypothetical protein
MIFLYPLFFLSIISLLSGFSGFLFFLPFLNRFLSEGIFLLFGWIAVKSDLVIDKLDSGVNLCGVVGRKQFDSLKLVDNFDTMVKVLFFRFFFSFFRCRLFLDFIIIILLLGFDYLCSTLQLFLPLFAKLDLSRSSTLGFLVFESSYGSKTVAVVNETVTKIDCFMVRIAINKIFLLLLKSCLVLLISFLSLFLSLLPLLLPLLVFFLLFLPFLLPFFPFLLFASLFFFLLFLPLDFILDPCDVPQEILLVFIIINSPSVLIHIVIDPVFEFIPLFFNCF